jgi:hypothetical protein
LSEEIRKIKQKYQTSTEDDEESLKNLDTCNDATDQVCQRQLVIKQSALQLRINEKKILSKLYSILHKYFYTLVS